jgi:hypothetical protein
MDLALDKISSPADRSPGELAVLAAAGVSVIVLVSRDSGNSDKPADLRAANIPATTLHRAVTPILELARSTIMSNVIYFSRAAGGYCDWDYRLPRATGRYEQCHRGRSRVISADRRHIRGR